jgi:hypothetical protein
MATHTPTPWPEAKMAAKRNNYDKSFRMVSQFGPRGDHKSLTLEVTGRDEEAVRIAAHTATGLLNGGDFQRFERRCINEWQAFASSMAGILGCATMTDDLLASAGRLTHSHAQLVAALRKAEAVLDRIASREAESGKELSAVCMAERADSALAELRALLARINGEGGGK